MVGVSIDSDVSVINVPADIVTTVSTSLDGLPEQHSAKAARLLAAAWLGPVRLIDNVAV